MMISLFPSPPCPKILFRHGAKFALESIDFLRGDRNNGIVEKALERYDLPTEAIGACRLSLTGGKRLSVENHKGLLEYTEEYIVLGDSKGSIRIRGEGLSIMAMEKEELIISGRILCIDLE